MSRSSHSIDPEALSQPDAVEMSKIHDPTPSDGAAVARLMQLDDQEDQLAMLLTMTPGAVKLVSLNPAISEALRQFALTLQAPDRIDDVIHIWEQVHGRAMQRQTIETTITPKPLDDVTMAVVPDPPVEPEESGTGEHHRVITADAQDASDDLPSMGTDLETTSSNVIEGS